MRKLLPPLALLIFAAGFAAPARAQCPYTSVSATITDPNGYPYSYGTVTYSLTPATSQPLCATIPFDGNPHQISLDVNGSFSVNLPRNASIVPGGTQWTFSVDGSAGVPPPIGKGSVSFSIAARTISGATQSLTSVFNAAAPALTNISSSGSGTPCTTIANSVQINLAGVFGCTDLTFSPSTLFASSADTIDFSAAVALKVPASPGYAPNASGVFGYDSTHNNFVGGEGFGSYIFPPISSGTIPGNGHLAIFNTSGGNVLLADGGAPGAGSITIAGTSVALGGSTTSFPSPGVIGGTTPAAATFTNLTASGTVTFSGLAADSLLVGNGSSAVTALTSPTVNGGCVVLFNVTASAAVAPTCLLQGVPVNPQTGAYPLVYSDRLSFIRESGTSTSTLTIPALGSGSFANNFGFVTGNFNTGIMSITPTTPNSIDAGSGQTPTSVFPNFAAFVYSDGSGNEWTIKVPMQAAFPSCSGGSNALTFNSTTGVFGCNTFTIPAAAVLTSAYTNASSAYTNVTGFSFSAAASSTHVMTCDLAYKGSATTAGPNFQVTGPAAPTTVLIQAFGTTGGGNVANGIATAFSSPITAFGSLSSGGVDYYVRVTVSVINGANTGTVQLQAENAGTGTVTIEAGAPCTIQ